MILLRRIWYFLKKLFGLIFPIFSKAANYRGWSTGLRWTLRIILLVGILVLLWVINNHVLRPEVVFKAPNRGIMRFWLPLLFLFLVCLSWLGWWLWRLLAPEGESTDFPDIDRAWDEARAALVDAGIDLTEVPLFLILGRPASSEEALFQAAQLPLLVRHVPRRLDAPLHVYADRDAVYVTCAGASVLGKHASLLAGDEEPGGFGDAAAPAVSQTDDEFKSMNIDAFKTQGAKGEALKEVHDILMRAQREGRMPTPAEKKRMRQLSGIPRPSLLKNVPEVERQAARLKHLCRLIVRDRRPYCPVNGILILVPFGGTDSEDDAAQAGQILQQDLTTAKKAFQVNCPMIAMVCDLETAPGFREFFERFPEKQRQRRVGQRFPLVPALEPAAMPGMIESGVQWICQTLFPTWIYKFFQVEGPGREDVAEQVFSNTQLYRLMYEMRERQRPLARMLTRGLLTDQSGPLLLGGCYVTATGREAREQAFTAGVFQRLVGEQNFVSWTAEAIAEENDYHRWTRIGYISVGIFTLLVLVVGFLWMQAGK